MSTLTGFIFTHLLVPHICVYDMFRLSLQESVSETKLFNILRGGLCEIALFYDSSDHIHCYFTVGDNHTFPI